MDKINSNDYTKKFIRCYQLNKFVDGHSINLIAAI